MSDTPDNEASFGLVVSFPDQSASFVHGFEAGQIWNRMQAGTEAEIELITHSANREVIQRMAVAGGWEVEAKPTSVEGWDDTALTKRRKVTSLPNPHGLRVLHALLDEEESP